MTKEQIIEIIKNNEMAPSLFYLTSKDGYDYAMEIFSNELANEILALYEAKLKEDLTIFAKKFNWYISEEFIDEYLKQRNKNYNND